LKKNTLFAAVVMLGGLAAFAATDPMVGGSKMFPSKNIVENALNSKDHTTLVAAVKAAGLVDTLEGPGPFTVFAPTNEAFAKLPAGTVDTLLKPENKDLLTKVLTYHVVPGRLSVEDIRKQIKAGNGTAMLKTASGGTLTATMTCGDSGRKGRFGHDHHQERVSVERRDPGGGHRVAAGQLDVFRCTLC
jgi:uncharacterized surface protein with fasciclin (FAS1) repeats